MTSTSQRNQQRPRPKAIVEWGLVGCMFVIIFLASAHTGDDLDRGTSLLGQAKLWLETALAPCFGNQVDPSPIGHFFEYLLLGALLYRALGNHLSGPARLGLAIAIASLYGVTDEIHQLFVPGRACDPADWLVDTLGAATGALAVLGLSRLRRGNPS